MNMNMNDEMRREVETFMENHGEAGTLFVMKGFPAEAFGGSRFVLSSMKDKRHVLRRAMEILDMERPVLSYSEYLALLPYLDKQFDHVWILKNNLYMKWFPLDAETTGEEEQAMKDYFEAFRSEEGEKDDEKEEAAEEETFVSLYGDVCPMRGRLMCCYRHTMADSGQEQAFSPVPRPMAEEEKGEITEVTSEKAYCDLLLRLTDTDEKVIVYDGEFWTEDKKEARARLGYLNGLFPGRVALCRTRTKREDTPLPEEVTGLLKKYWKADSFRMISCYDLDALNEGKKVMRQVSQGYIISDILKEARRSVKCHDGRDIFVTAPTGSGKSLMFQLPAMYLAKKEGLLTLVISPLIGLMNDQVDGLKRMGYQRVAAIHSDMAPVEKEAILEDVRKGNCDILYLSPETLIAKGDLQQMIGDRRIGMVVIDEAHIVVTWGKQFRPDYWYLGDRLRKIRAKQQKKDGSSFMVAAFTATAIYRGEEDMYRDMVDSLHLVDPITYLGCMKRDDIRIEISPLKTGTSDKEYRMDKYRDILATVRKALLEGKKVLVYFPTIQLIHDCYAFCQNDPAGQKMCRYYGGMRACDKVASQKDFKSGNKPVMLATKAFGMGVDIPDIDVIVHFAPTGNVCDYTQEIGRAARKKSLLGSAVYHHSVRDFKYINQLQGMSAIQKWQLTEVMKKILDIYQLKQRQGIYHYGKKNQMLVDASDFKYIFAGARDFDDGEAISKVKTAMLLIEKDYVRRQGYSPFYMRPTSIFKIGYFRMDEKTKDKLNDRYPTTVERIEGDVYKVNLGKIWEKSLQDELSFPAFKYKVYSGDPDFPFNQAYNLQAVMRTEVVMDGKASFPAMIGAMRKAIRKVIGSRQITKKEVVKAVRQSVSGDVGGLSYYQAEAMTDALLSGMRLYQERYRKGLVGYMIHVNQLSDGSTIKYGFEPAAMYFFDWISEGFRTISARLGKENVFYLPVSEKNGSNEMQVILAVLESWGILHFASLGGSDAQLYVHLNGVKELSLIRDNPIKYRNGLLDNVRERRQSSLNFLRHLYEEGLSSEEIWDELEDYFLGLYDRTKRVS